MPTDMEVDIQVDISDVKKCLRDAGMYEENMNEEEMRTYYNAIKSSETAFVEDTHNRTEIIVSDIEKEPQEEELQVDDLMLSPQETKDTNITLENDDSINFDPLNCFPIKHKPLDVIYHKPKYGLAPHIDPGLSKLPVEERTKIILAFHKGLLQKFYEAHKTSKLQAPLGRAIQSSERFIGVLERKTPTNSYEFTDETLPESAYVSRSGRQTKRKVYVEPYESDNEKKKSKKEDEKEKEEYRPVSKRQGSSMKNNQEIMKRSRFFSDSPKSSRSDKIFDQLTLSEKKRQKDVEKTDKFHATLAKLSDDEDVVPSSQPAVPANEDVMVIEDAKTTEPPYIKRRVPPPLRGRRGLGPRGRGGSSTLDLDKSKLVQSSTSKCPSPQSPSVSSLRIEARPPPSNSYTSTPEPKQKSNSTKGKTKCPICSDLFNIDEIEAHASNCGLGMENSVTFDSIVNDNGQKIKCNVCDKDMPMNTDYEAHVNECMRKARFK